MYVEKVIVVYNTDGNRLRGRAPSTWADQTKDSSFYKFYAVVTAWNLTDGDKSFASEMAKKLTMILRYEKTTTE